MEVSRRKFMKFLGAAPLVAAVPSIVTGAAKSKLVINKPSTTGFGLAQLKPEGGSMNYDSFAKALWPGINKWYGESYDHEYLKKFYS